MAIILTCAQCQKKLSLRDELAGKKVRCPGCQAVLSIPAASVNDATAPVTSATTKMQTCPSCQKPVPAGEVSCPHCKYHFKLRRKMGISSVIQSADMYSQGLNVDGSKRITTADLTEARVEKSRKVAKVMIIGVVVILIIAAAMFINFIYRNTAEMSLADIRQQHSAPPPHGKRYETWQPFWMYQDGDEKLNLTIPLANIVVLTVGEKANPEKNIVAFPAHNFDLESKSWAQFVETIMPPVVNTLAKNGRSRYVDNGESRVVPALIRHANTFSHPYTPQNLAAAFPSPKSKIYLWRQSRDLTQKGALHGALLEFSAAAKKVIEAAMKKSPATGEITLTAQLSFIPFINRDLSGGAYAHAVSNGATLVREPHNAVKERADGEKNKNANDVYFAPILIVESAEMVAPKKTEKK